MPGPFGRVVPLLSRDKLAFCFINQPARTTNCYQCVRSSFFMVSAARLRDVYKLQCWVFNKPFNPEHKRIGTKVLQEPLKGDLLKNYYYPSLKGLPTPKKLNKIFPDWNCYDPDEEYRLQRVEYLKRKGKGAPAKLKEKKVVEKKRR